MRAQPHLDLRRDGDSLVLHGAREHDGAAVYAGPAPDRIDRRQPVARFRGEERVRLDVRFELEDEHGRERIDDVALAR